MKKNGFTLIELVVVMAIIAILSLLIIAAITAARRASINTARMGDVKTVETALETYSMKNGGRYVVTSSFGSLLTKLKTEGYLSQYPASFVDESTSTGFVSNLESIYLYDGDGTRYSMGACALEATTSISINNAVNIGELDRVGGCLKSGTSTNLFAYRTSR